MNCSVLQGLLVEASGLKIYANCPLVIILLNILHCPIYWVQKIRQSFIFSLCLILPFPTFHPICVSGNKINDVNVLNF